MQAVETFTEEAVETEEKPRRGRKKVSLSDYATEIPENLFRDKINKKTKEVVKDDDGNSVQVLRSLTKTDFPHSNEGQNAFWLYMSTKALVMAERALTKKDPIQAKKDKIAELQKKIADLTASLG